MDTPVKQENTIQTSAITIHGRLAIQIHSENKQRQRNTRHFHSLQHHRTMHRHTRLHDTRRHKGSDFRR